MERTGSGLPQFQRAKLSEIPSPCTGICTLNPERICIGCGRTLSEIGEWISASDEQKREIVAAACKRKPRS
ncbi:DUF1289 domain-containing protein [Allosphingosinicella flava]|uniref:DUF1289 domain-containing protein n=1 Tax=Allosphingosinicella flava TaxID=2771430 RepID=UPI001CF78EF7|nr:DUF1289 domain-containing protein [Sphingosinicella flava]